MLRISNFKVEVKECYDLLDLLASKLHVKRDLIKNLTIHKKSIDARSKHSFSYVFELDFDILNEDDYVGKNIRKVNDVIYKLPNEGKEKLALRPVIVGSGPAGLFCAYNLARAGFKPIVIEQGDILEKRVEKVNRFWNSGEFDCCTNVQFGEGGAGTFSDGKLNTLVSDKLGIMKEVFKIFVKFGAHEDILYENKPHIGTDVLRSVVVNIREEIKKLGGDFLFNSKMEDIIISNGRIKKIIVNGEVIKTDILVLAIGHSARDTFRLLHKKGLNMEAKPFAVGVRVIHHQNLINENQYPINYPFLPAASYKLTYKTKSNRGVYSFCMCPGGVVVDARSNSKGVVVNGMSYNKRDSGYANSAIVVTVGPSDFGSNLFDGLEFQETLESKAYSVGNGFIPGMSFLDYYHNTFNEVNINNGVFGRVKYANINEVFPEFINESLKEGIIYFDKLINGFSKNAILLAPESRTSSPVRIIRNDEYESNILGIYPAGEGAGYAGGITTSAMDGIKIADKIISTYNKGEL